MHAALGDSAQLFRLVQFFDILAAAVFAVSGALVASRTGMDVMGFMWFAVITGVGGGTVRDLILNVPVFWVQNPVRVVPEDVFEQPAAQDHLDQLRTVSPSAGLAAARPALARQYGS